MNTNQEVVLMQGNEACVHGAIAAGMRFFSGYPITPSTEIAEVAAVQLPLAGGKFIQMEDEIAGIAAAIGASVTGVKSMTATSGPGFSLKQENIGYACLAEIPCVIVNVQRSGPSTGLSTSPSQADYMQARWGTHGDHPVIAISPSSVKETYDLSIRCFNLAEKYRTPVILLMDEIVGHLREGIVPYKPDPAALEKRPEPAAPGERPPYAVGPGEYVPAMLPFGKGQRYNITGLIHDEDGFPTNSNDIAAGFCERLMRKIQANLDDIIQVEEQQLDDADTAIVCFGGTARSVMGAVLDARAQGARVGMFRPVTVWPFPERQVRELAGRVGHILVVEHNYGQMVLEVERAAGGKCPVSHLGKIDGTVITPGEILQRLEEIRNGK